MSESPLSDPRVQRAVSQVQLRSERQENLDQLIHTFVDPGISVQLQNRNNQIVYGRRGTGKTHVLKVVQAATTEGESSFAIYIDMRTLGSSSVFSDEGRPTHVRVASLLKDILAHIETGLLDWATRPEVDVQGLVFETLDRLSDSITHSVLSDVQVLTEVEMSGEESRSRGHAASISQSPSLSLGAGKETKETERGLERRQGAERPTLFFQELASSLSEVIQAAGIDQLTILIDEWTAVPLDLQPLLAEFLKRTLFADPRVTVKIASIEYRSDFSRPLGKNNILGFELGADISSLIELDDYFVFDRNPDQTVRMFSELLFRHISAEVDEDDQEAPGYLARQYSIADQGQFVRDFFASREAFQELVRGGEGVARDLINIFTSAFFNAVRRGRKTIDIRAVQEAAREWYEKDKSQNVDESQERVLRTILDEVIGARRARSFLLEKRFEKNESIRSLFDFRVIHIVQRGYADKDNPGIRYNIYTLDYGTYVDLLGTKNAPSEDFTEALAESEEDVVVPFDDKRSIRRIIFRPEHLDDDQEGIEATHESG